MIWTTQHISDEIKRTERFILDFLQKQALSAVEEDNCFRVGIVGGGPKGLYALEQSLDQLRQRKRQIPIEIYWWNPTEDFGSGPNYQAHQPDYLLINYCIGHVDAWMRPASDTVDRRNLLSWIRRFCRGGDKAQPTDFASRALVGHYLRHVVEEVIRSVPDNVRLSLIVDEIKNITPLDPYFVLHTGTQQWKVHQLLLATGHCYRNAPLLTTGNPHSRYINKAYPISNLDSISAGSAVGIVGLGLTFIDVALHLTEGRGGVFDVDGHYIKNGQEPIIFPFSRNHLPIIPRGPIYGDNVYRLHYLNAEWVQQIDAIHHERKINFSEEIYPVLDKEVRFAYYSTLLQTRDTSEVEQYINSLEEEQLFSLEKLLFPTIEKKESLQQTYIDYLEYLIGEAEKGEIQSPLMAAAAVWREATPIIGKWYKACGFTGDSQRKLDKELFGAFCRTSFGPPVANMKKIVSLLKSNIIQMIFEEPVEIVSDSDRNMLTLRAGAVIREVSFVIDARIARPDLGKNNSGLYWMLSQNRLITPLENDRYRPGCAQMDVDGSSMVDGKKLNLFFYGSNTEGFLLDNDSLSRTKNNLATSWVAHLMEQIDNHQKKINTCA